MGKTALKIVSALALFWPAGLSAAVDAAHAAALGKNLTPVGAERQGNAAGTIPAWEGGLAKDAYPHANGGHYADPFAKDKPLFTITSKNVDQYKEQLTPGQLALFAQFPDYTMVVYPTRRTASFPAAFYQKTRENATKTILSHGGNGVLNATDGVPFPIPKDGAEAVWNVLLRFRGPAFRMNSIEAPVLRNGTYTPSRCSVDFEPHYNNLDKPLDRRTPNLFFEFLQTFASPPRLAGSILLVHEPVDQVKQHRTAWLYNPGQRRVRLAPTLAYDNLALTAEGLRTYDDYNMYNGSPDRYQWTLIGKKEMFVPYNSYRLNDPALRYKDILKAGHLNQEVPRYERHRVWVLEGTLKKGFRHLYARRVFYLDEDSWIPLLSDKYDAGGKLSYFAEQHLVNYFEVPMPWASVTVFYDLPSGRYLALNLTNEESSPWKERKFPAAYFTPANLRGQGTR
ncbi:MAG: DUF1329 domain-containing protein [Elusimicrobia bacterium]|nr:DUF1329 domain-containing protein [Elusimicrobiota bacterium]